MARKELFLKPGSYYYSNPKDKHLNAKDGQLRKHVLKFMRESGVPVVDPCCPPLDFVPVAMSLSTGDLYAFVDGAYVPVDEYVPPATTTVEVVTTTTEVTTTAEV